MKRLTTIEENMTSLSLYGIAVEEDTLTQLREDLRTVVRTGGKILEAGADEFEQHTRTMEVPWLPR